MIRSTTDKCCSPNKELHNETTGECFVYVITNALDGSQYIGKALNPAKRWRDHKRCAEKGHVSLPHLYNALRMHGIDQFYMCIEGSYATEDAAFVRERELIIELRTMGVHLYNVSTGGRGGIKYTVQQRKSHSEIQKAWSNTPEARERNSAAQLQDDVREKKRLGSQKYWNENEEFRTKVLARTQSVETLTFTHNVKAKPGKILKLANVYLMACIDQMLCWHENNVCHMKVIHELS